MNEHQETPSSKSQIIVTPRALVVSLDEANQKKARACLEKRGEITFSIREVSVTKLPHVLDNGVLID